MQQAFEQTATEYLQRHLPAEPTAVQVWRQAHWAQFLKQGIPHQRLEAWRYTNIAPLFKLDLPQNLKTETGQLPALMPFAQDRLIIADGKLVAESQSLAAGINISRLADKATPVINYLNTAPGNIDSGVSVLADVNAALATEVLLIKIADNTNLTQPLVIEHFISENSQPQSHHVRVIIAVGTNAKVNLIQRFSGAGNYAQNTVTEIRIAAGANVDHTVLQQDSHSSVHAHSIVVTQMRDSLYNAFSLALGARLARVDWMTQLLEVNAKTRLDGLFVVGKHQHIDHHTRIDHLANYTESDQLYRGIMLGHGAGVFEGKIVVAPKIKGVNAAQTNNNLLLCEQAEINTKPELQIYSDDVKCAHGATVGRLDPDAVFFLQARGLDLAMAQEMLTFAFAKQVLQRLPEVQREYMSAQVLASDSGWRV